MQLTYRISLQSMAKFYPVIQLVEGMQSWAHQDENYNFQDNANMLYCSQPN